MQRELLVEIGGFDERWQHGEDTDLWLRVLLTPNMQALWIPEPGATYHMNSVNRLCKNLFQVSCPSAASIKDYLGSHPVIAEDLDLQLRQYANAMSLKPLLRRIITADCSIKDISDLLFWRCLPLKTKLILMGLLCLRGGLRRKAALTILEKGV